MDHGFKTIQEICQEHGKAWEDVLKQKAIEAMGVDVKMYAETERDAVNFNIATFDEMTRRGAKLNLITGEYEFPKPT
jgi:hypothetical protein